MKKQSKKGITYTVDARITKVSGGHVCHTCGHDADLMETSYEVITQEAIDLFNQEVTPHQHKPKNDVYAIALHSQAAEVTYRATYQEQSKEGPQEHGHKFACLSCVNKKLSILTGRPDTAFCLVKLGISSNESAIFIVRRADNTDQTIVINAPFQDAGKLKTIPELK